MLRRVAVTLVAALVLMPAGRAQAQVVSIAASGASPKPLATVQAAVSAFEESVGGIGCVGPAQVVFERIKWRGEYRTTTATVAINPNRAAKSLTYTTVHELSHHAMISCGLYEDASFTTAFYESQGLPAERGWFDYSAGWAATPAEQFADALAFVITGHRDARIRLSSGTVTLVEGWLTGA
jgi:hypothetical protein